MGRFNWVRMSIIIWGKDTFFAATAVVGLAVGFARLRRGQDELRGAQISYNANTEFYRVIGQPNAQSPAGRVRAVIRPKPTPDSAATPEKK